MRKTTTTPNRSITSTTNWWGKPALALVLTLLVLIACEEDTYLLGFQKPDRNFKVSYAEFKIPTSVVLIDSVNSVNGTTSAAVRRLLVGNLSDPQFGNTKAVAFTQFAPPISAIAIHDTAVFSTLSLTVVVDFYNIGNPGTSEVTLNVMRLRDSLVNSHAYFSNSVVTYNELLGTTSRAISPALFDEDFAYNSNTANTVKHVDSITFDLSASFGQELFAEAKNTDAAAVSRFNTFRKFRRMFNGFAIVPASADKIIGLDPTHAKSRLVLRYREAGVTKAITFTIGTTADTDIIGFSQITTDRSATALSGINYFEERQPGDGSRYIQSGTGLVAKMDFSEVYEHFKAIPIKALNVADLSVQGMEGEKLPETFFLRVMKPNNRFFRAVTNTTSIVGDTLVVLDQAFGAKHYANLNTNGTVDIVGDDKELMVVRKSADAPALYSVSMASFLQQEFLLPGSEALKQFALIPLAPDFGRSVNSFVFNKDQIILKVYYTTPIQSEQ